MKLYGVARPDGTLVYCLPSEEPLDAFLRAAKAEIPRGQSGAELRKDGESLYARCWRARNESCDFSGYLAREIALLMGYKLVEVEVSIKKGKP